MRLYRDHSASTSLGKRGSKWRMQQKVTQKGGCAVEKVMSLSQILLCTFFSNSIFIPSWVLTKPWLYYSEQQKQHIQERAYQCIWSNYIMFAQKYYNSTNLWMWVVYATCVSKNSVVYQDVIFHLLWYNVIRWSSHIRKKSSFLSFYSFLVKFNE